MVHTKQKGNLGFSATLKEIHKLGLNVFTELGDNSKIDMIVEFEGKLVKLQIKYIDDSTGKAALCTHKTGPNGHRYRYSESDVDIFSVYLPKTDKVFFVPAKEVLSANRYVFTLRVVKSKNNQQKKVRNAEQFSDLIGILRDFTLGISKRDDDKVQTTTEMASEN